MPMRMLVHSLCLLTIVVMFVAPIIAYADAPPNSGRSAPPNSGFQILLG